LRKKLLAPERRGASAKKLCAGKGEGRLLLDVRRREFPLRRLYWGRKFLLVQGMGATGKKKKKGRGGEKKNFFLRLPIEGICAPLFDAKESRKKKRGDLFLDLFSSGKNLYPPARERRKN